MSFISTRLATLPPGQRSTQPPSSSEPLTPSGSGGTSLSPDVQQWEVQWEQIHIERAM